MNIVVYTALFGDKDLLWSVPPTAAMGARYIVFTEKARREVGLWTRGGLFRRPTTILPGSGSKLAVMPRWEQHFVSVMDFGPRRTARYYKAMVHEVLPDADVWIWVDANIRLLLRPSLAAKWLGNRDLAAFRHPNRDCAYQEVKACIQLRKTNKSLIQRQISSYRREGLPTKWGLASTRCIVRRNTEAQRELNEAWWKQIQLFSERDQVSLPFVCWKMGRRWAVIPGSAEHGKDFWFTRHGRVP